MKKLNLTTLHIISDAIVFIYFFLKGTFNPSTNIRNRVAKKDKRTQSCSTHRYIMFFYTYQ